MSNTIIDDYELLNCLATGNISQIWEVKQVSSSQTFAMKLLLPEALANPDHKASLKHEASVGKKFDHPNIIRINELKFTKKHGYFIMEYFRAPNLKSMLRSDLTGARMRVKKMMECVTPGACAHAREGVGASRRQAGQHPDQQELRSPADRLFAGGASQRGSGAAPAQQEECGHSGNADLSFSGTHSARAAERLRPTSTAWASRCTKCSAAGRRSSAAIRTSC